MKKWVEGISASLRIPLQNYDNGDDGYDCTGLE